MPLTKLIQLMEEKLGKDVITEEVVADFKAQTEVLINEQVKSKVKVIEENLKDKYREDAETFKTELVENIDAYMDYASKEYLKENQVAIEKEYTVKAAEELIEAFAKILENNHFKVEPAKNKSLEEAQKKIAQLKTKLNESEKKVIEKDKECFEFEKAVAFSQLTEELSKPKKEKALELLEGLEFTDIKEFKKKLSVVIEKVTAKPVDKKEEIVEEKKKETKSQSSIDKYL